MPGLLAIYHLYEDSYENVANGSVEFIPNSQGLTLNATAQLSYDISDHIKLTLTGGSPLVVREYRPAGLTRHFVVRGGATYQF